ncbi:MAG TPA: DNRLRE domain-containing protein [Myxococcaceae bacterium]|jgi:hypothetical protein
MEIGQLSSALAETKVFAPIADARVDQTAPAANYATSHLDADLSPHQQAFLKFSLAGISDRVQSARLRLYALDSTSDGPAVYQAQNGWTETGVVWNNRPALSGGVLADKGAYAAGTWVEWDVTSAVQRDGEISFALIPTSSDGASFHARESSSTSLRPQLVVELKSTGFPTPTDCMARTDVYLEQAYLWDDIHVEQAYPTSTFHYSSTVKVDASPRQEGFVSFSGVYSTHTVRRATLSLYAADATSDGPAVYRSTPINSYPQHSWNTRPSPTGPVLSDAGAIRANTWVHYDVTAAVREGIARFALMPTSTDGVEFISRDQPHGTAYVDYTPRLEVEFETPPFCTYRGTGSGGTRNLIHDGGTGSESLGRLATTADGDIVALGWAKPGATIGGGSFSDRRQFVVRYRPDGTVVWVRTFPQAIRIEELAVTSLGNVLITGTYDGNPDFGNGPIAETGSSSLYVLKLSPGGATTWVRGFSAWQNGPEGLERVPVFPLGIATDAQGSAIITGAFYGRMDLGGGMLQSNAPLYDDEEGAMFLVKFDWEGNHAWSKGYTESSYTRRSRGYDVATDAQGNIYLSGYVSPHTDLGDGEKGGTWHMPFVARYTAGGQLAWKKVYRESHGGIYRIAVNGDGLRLAFSGSFGGAFDFAGTRYEIAPPEYEDTEPFTGVVQTNGGDVWIRRGLSASALAYDGTDLIVSGFAFNPVNLGGGELGTDTGYHWVVRMLADGTHRWSRALDPDFLVTGLAAGNGVVLGGNLTGPFEHDGATRALRGESDVMFLRLAP